MCCSDDTDTFLKVEVVAGGRRGSLWTRIYYSHFHVVFKSCSDVTCSFLMLHLGKQEPPPWARYHVLSRMELDWTKDSYPKCELLGFLYMYIHLYVYGKYKHIWVCMCLFYLVLKDNPLAESHLHFILFVFLRFSSLFLCNGEFFFFLNYFFAQLWEESWDLQRQGEVWAHFSWKKINAAPVN